MRGIMIHKITTFILIILISMSAIQKISAQGKNDKESGKATTEDQKTAEPENKYTEADAKEDKLKVDRIENTLDYGMQKDRITAMNLIHTIKSEDMKKRVLRRVIKVIEQDSNLEAKKTAITITGDLKFREAIPALIKALNDDSEDIQIAACYALGKLEAHEAKNDVIEILKKRDLGIDSNLTDSLIILLSDLKSPDILDYAVTSIKDPKTGQMARERLMIYIGKTGSAAQKDFLIGILNDEDENMTIRSHAVKAIGALKIKEAAGDIKKLLKDIEEFPFKKKKNYYNLSMHAVAALVALGDSDSVELLMNSLRSDNASVRLNAVKLIKDFDDERTIDILKYKMKYDPNQRVKRAAKKALEEKGLIEKDKDSDNTDNDTEAAEDNSDE